MITAQGARRKMDALGRIKIPTEFAKRMELEKFQQVEVTIEYGKICIKKFNEETDLKEKPYTGIVRLLDDIGRVCIPKEYLNILKVPTGIKVDLLLDEDKIIIWVVE